jgi:ATP-dependent DNA helicase RecG
VSLRLDDEIRYVKGIGPHRAAALAERGIRTVEDLLFHLPTRYEDRSRLLKVRDVRPGTLVTVSGRVMHAGLVRTRRRNFSIYSAVVDDGTGCIRVVFFNQPWLQDKLVRGTNVILHGKVGTSPRTEAAQVENPAFEIVEEGAEEDVWGSLVPIHPALPGLTPRSLRRVIREVLSALPAELPQSLPRGAEDRHGLVSRRQAHCDVQVPPPGAVAEELGRAASAAHQRLIFEELFAMQLAFLLRRREAGSRPDRRRYDLSPALGDRLRAALPFRLTPGQRAAFRDIAADLGRPAPMARLLQGDVGSGKTIVALLAMLVAAEHGWQAALMAPTEILAEQHASRFRRVLGEGWDVGLLTGSVPARERRRILAGLQSGDLRLVVGTHALIQEGVAFANLQLVVIDEQHRFGVAQRTQLLSKAEAPDVLVLSATPIPRTLALTLHGDLDVSVIPDRPPGRKPIKTVLREARSRPKVVRFIAEQVDGGRQAYVVHPVIAETEDVDVAAAVAGAARLQEALRPRRVGLVHGQLASDERDRVMRAFARAELDVLVATTVIEVGIDVPNATVMVVESAERFGLAQLHQLRGRVGRGEHESWCILVAGGRPTEEARERLRLLETTDDGFLLAEKDLQMRGAGELLGLRQVGLRDLRVADPVRDRAVLEAAREEARLHLASLSDADLDLDPLVRAARARWLPAAQRTAAG